jgi:uncharacterized protein (AIM24 family)
MIAQNRIDVHLEDGDAPLYVRTGAFLKHPHYTLHAPHKCRATLMRLCQRMYFMAHVEEGSFTLTTPFDNAHIVKLRVQEGEQFVIDISHVLAFSTTMFFQHEWRIFDKVSLLLRKFRYTYFTGPGDIYLFGIGGNLTIEDADGVACYDKDVVVGWSNDLKIGVSTRSNLVTAAMGVEEIMLEHFEGQGKVLLQAANCPVAVGNFAHHGRGSSLIDYVNALIGLR